MAKNIRPLYDRVLVRRLEINEEKTAGGIIIPDAAKEKGHTAKVIAVGSGRVSSEGKVTSLQVKVGDVVLLGKYSGTEAGEKDLVIVREDEILGIIE